MIEKNRLDAKNIAVIGYGIVTPCFRRCFSSIVIRLKIAAQDFGDDYVDYEQF